MYKMSLTSLNVLLYLKNIPDKTILLGLVIAMEILWVRHEPKDCNGKHDPEGNPQNY